MSGRRVLGVRCAFVLGVAGALVGAARGAPPRPEAPTREERVERWALSYAPSDPAVRARVADLVRACAPDTEEQLLAMGEPARRALLSVVAEDADVARVARPWLARMQSLEDEVERRGLSHDVGTLAVLGADGARRVARIVPDGVAGDPVRWCAERAGALRFEPAADRLVYRPTPGADEAPLRMRGRAKVELAGTSGLVAFDTPITLEMWVRVLDPTRCYLATDEAWPEMSPEVPTAVEAGFALRRNGRGPDMATLEMTCGVAPRGWWTIESAPLRLRPGWQVAGCFEHIAVTSDGHVVRLFRDGELVAARAIDGAQFVRGVGNLCLGLRRHAYRDRLTGMDVRGFRLSEGARYVADFVPPPRLVKDDATLVLLDFTPSPTIDGRTALRDLSGGGHDGGAEGARFVAPLTPERLRADLAELGDASGDIVVAEAEDGGGTERWYVSGREADSAGANAEIYCVEEPGREGHVLAVPFRLPRDGAWRVHLLGAGLSRGAEGPSPFAWQVDDGPWTPQLRARPALFGVGGEPDLDLAPLGVADLTAGEHVFRLRLLSRVTRADHRFSIWVDGVVLRETR